MSDDRPAINAVLEHYGSPTKDRRSYMTNCVFHEDRTPSLSVNTEKDVWNCMSCGQRGDSYTLIMLKEEVNFGGAREVAASLGLATGSAGGSGDDVRGGYYSGSRRTPARKGDRPRNGGYVPRWRRQ